MSTKSYSNIKTIEQERELLGRNLDKYCKFYWRGEDMWETYHTFITNNGSSLKFVNGPSFSNEYSSPQYDHATGNLTGVKFTRMQVSFNICSYGVSAKEYRSLILALGPYEIDYLSFDYDKKLCYLAKTISTKEAVKTIIGVNTDGEDVYLVENTITFEVQGEQCAIAQRQYVWTVDNNKLLPSKSGYAARIFTPIINPKDHFESSELSFGVVAETVINNIWDNKTGMLNLYITDEENYSHTDKWIQLCHIQFNPITKDWRNTESVNGSPSSLQEIDKTISIKYDSTSGLVFAHFGNSNYKILNLLYTNNDGSYLIKNMITQKVKIEKNQKVREVYFVWEWSNEEGGITPVIDLEQTKIYGRAKAILM